MVKATHNVLIKWTELQCKALGGITLSSPRVTPAIGQAVFTVPYWQPDSIMETGLLDTESGGSELAESPYLSILTMVTDKDEVSEEGDTDVITLRPKTESDGDDESDEEEDEEDTDLRDRSLRHCVHSRPCSICIYLVIALVILASLVAMIVIGVLIVAPFRRVSGFAHTTCETVGLETRLEHKRCSCGKGCNSKYPCIKVAVITPELVEEHKNHVVLFDNEATLLREVRYWSHNSGPLQRICHANRSLVTDIITCYWLTESYRK